MLSQINFALASLADVPGNVLSVYAMRWKITGRRGTLVLSLIFSGLCCFLLTSVHGTPAVVRGEGG